MGCKDGFHNTGIIVKIAFFIVSISMFCNWLAFTTNSWIRKDTSRYMYVGLWRYSGSDEFVSGSGPTDGTGNTKMGVIQAFAIVGFLSQNVGYLLIVLFMFKDNYRGNQEVGLASSGLLIISAIGWLISVAIFGAEVKEIKDSDSTNWSEYLHYSYAFAVIACGLGLIGGILMIVGGRGHRLAVSN